MDEIREPQFSFEREPGATDLKIIQKPEGSFGIFREYPDELNNKIAEQVATFRSRENDKTYGYRDKFPLDIVLENGQKLKLYVKAKFIDPLTAKDAVESYKRDMQRAATYTICSRVRRSGDRRSFTCYTRISTQGCKVYKNYKLCLK